MSRCRSVIQAINTLSGPRMNGRSRGPNGRRSISIRWPVTDLPPATPRGVGYLSWARGRHYPDARSHSSGKMRYRTAPAKLWIASSTSDADLFLVLRVFDPRGDEVLFRGAIEPKQPVSKVGYGPRTGRSIRSARRFGSLCMASREAASAPRAGLRTRRGDLADVYRGSGGLPARAVHLRPRLRPRPRGHNVALGARHARRRGFWHHTDSTDRPPEICDGMVTLYGGGTRQSYVLLPVIPSSRQSDTEYPAAQGRH